MGQKEIILLISVFNAIAAFNTLVVLFIMARGYRSHTPANRALAFFLFSSAIANLMLFLIYTGGIYRLPWLYRLPSPLYYMMFPAAWLYVRMIIKDQVHLKKSDLLHFIPGVLHFFEMVPYYLTSSTYKFQHVVEDAPQIMGAYMHNEGILPPYLHNLLRGAQGTIYGILMIRIVFLAFYKKRTYRAEFPIVKKWLTAFSICVFVFAFSIFLTFIGTWASPAFRSLNLSFFVAATQAITALSLLTNPQLLFGMPRLSQVKLPDEPAVPVLVPGEDSVVPLSTIADADGSAMDQFDTDAVIGHATEIPDWVEAQMPRLEAFLRESDSYLKNRFTIREMSEEIGIPQHHLSFLLNRVYNLRFNDFINTLRIEYVRKRVFMGNGLKQMTLEGLAKEAGFSNRTTFIRVVQKLTGKNPSDYFSHDENNRAIDMMDQLSHSSGQH